MMAKKKIFRVYAVRELKRYADVMANSKKDANNIAIAMGWFYFSTNVEFDGYWHANPKLTYEVTKKGVRK